MLHVSVRWFVSAFKSFAQYDFLSSDHFSSDPTASSSLRTIVSLRFVVVRTSIGASASSPTFVSHRKYQTWSRFSPVRLSNGDDLRNDSATTFLQNLRLRSVETLFTSIENRCVRQLDQSAESTFGTTFSPERKYFAHETQFVAGRRRSTDQYGEFRRRYSQCLGIGRSRCQTETGDGTKFTRIDATRTSSARSISFIADHPSRTRLEFHVRRCQNANVWSNKSREFLFVDEGLR